MSIRDSIYTIHPVINSALSIITNITPYGSTGGEIVISDDRVTVLETNLNNAYSTLGLMVVFNIPKEISDGGEISIELKSGSLIGPGDEGDPFEDEL
jgi:hypothetical protein